MTHPWAQGIFPYIYHHENHTNQPNVDKYTVRPTDGMGLSPSKRALSISNHDQLNVQEGSSPRMCCTKVHIVTRYKLVKQLLYTHPEYGWVTL